MILLQQRDGKETPPARALLASFTKSSPDPTDVATTLQLVNRCLCRNRTTQIYMCTPLTKSGKGLRCKDIDRAHCCRGVGAWCTEADREAGKYS
jgi:hypothetical protein